MKVIKRNGTEVVFDISKILVAVGKANNNVKEEHRMTPMQIQRIAESVELNCIELGRSPSVEEIQDMVEHQIMAHGAFEVAKEYITYRYTRSLVRRSNTTDDKILSLIECNNEEAKQENSNKNPIVNSTQRDYMAGEVSRDITNRLLLPKDIVRGARGGHHPFSRRRLLCPAYAQLRPGQSGGHAPERHGHHRHVDRAARTPSPPPAISPPRSSRRSPPTSTAASRFPWRTWRPLCRSAAKRSAASSARRWKRSMRDPQRRGV